MSALCTNQFGSKPPIVNIHTYTIRQLIWENYYFFFKKIARNYITLHNIIIFLDKCEKNLCLNEVRFCEWNYKNGSTYLRFKWILFQ